MRGETRSSNGSIVALAFVAAVPLVLAIGGFGVDCMHFSDERGALQRATDAGALAGAIDIPNWRGNLEQSSTINSGTNFATGKTGTNEEPVDMALATTGLNMVDGQRPVTDGSTITVTATMLHQYTPSVQQSDASNPPIACQVSAQMQIKSIFAAMFGNWQQTISTTSIAGQGQQLTTVYKYLPLLLSAPEGDQNGSDLPSMQMGAGYGLNLPPGPGVVEPSGNGGVSHSYGNVAWIFPTDAANAAAISAFNGGPPATEPALSVDSTIATQLPSYTSPLALAAFNNLQPGEVVVLPVTADWITQPDPNGNPPTAGPHKVIGYVGMQLQHLNSGGSWWVNIVPAVGSGNSGGVLDTTYQTYQYVPQAKVSGVSLVK